MSWKRWIDVTVVVGGGAVLLTSGSRWMEMGADRGAPGAVGMAAPTETPGALRTVALDVTGMT